MHVRSHAVASAALLFLALTGGPLAAAAQPSALDRAHAHNDYEHDRPLLDALDHGFNSVEVDIFLVDGDLLVAHDRDDVRADRTLEGLYLAPLRARAQQNEGRIHPGRPPLLLLVDVKSDAEATYGRLRAALRQYADVLTLHAGAVTLEGAVSVVISGERPRATMRASTVRFAAFDGRLPDLEEGAALSPAFMPLVSARWSDLTAWTGDGPVSDDLRAELTALAGHAHAQGRRLRFWGTPEREAVWALLLETGVDLLNTDALAGLRAFLLRGDE